MCVSPDGSPRHSSLLLIQIRFCAVVSEELVTWSSGPAQPAASQPVLPSWGLSPTLRMLLAPSLPLPSVWQCLAPHSAQAGPLRCAPHCYPSRAAPTTNSVTKISCQRNTGVMLELNLRIQPKLPTKLPVEAPEFFSFPVREFPKMYPLRCLA